EFIQMGINAEKLTGKKVLPASPDKIKTRMNAIRDSVSSWVLEGVKELESKIRNGEAIVALPISRDDIDRIRATYG
ncbi:MAG: hypothetical protein RQ855_07685, partial [Desulfurococcales archaeon]|nr:hypothetical protein [Desulfurococcales archaeon]